MSNKTIIIALNFKALIFAFFCHFSIMSNLGSSNSSIGALFQDYNWKTNSDLWQYYLKCQHWCLFRNSFWCEKFRYHFYPDLAYVEWFIQNLTNTFFVDSCRFINNLETKMTIFANNFSIFLDIFVCFRHGESMGSKVRSPDRLGSFLYTPCNIT